MNTTSPDFNNECKKSNNIGRTAGVAAGVAAVAGAAAVGVTAMAMDKDDDADNVEAEPLADEATFVKPAAPKASADNKPASGKPADDNHPHDDGNGNHEDGNHDDEHREEEHRDDEHHNDEHHNDEHHDDEHHDDEYHGGDVNEEMTVEPDPDIDPNAVDEIIAEELIDPNDIDAENLITAVKEVGTEFNEFGEEVNVALVTLDDEIDAKLVDDNMDNVYDRIVTLDNQTFLDSEGNVFNPRMTVDDAQIAMARDNTYLEPEPEEPIADVTDPVAGQDIMDDVIA